MCLLVEGLSFNLENNTISAEYTKVKPNKTWYSSVYVSVPTLLFMYSLG